MSTNLKHGKRERRRKRESRRLACVAGANRVGEEGREKSTKERCLCMIQFDLLPSPPQGIPPGMCKFCLSWWSIFQSPGTQKETIPHPWAPDRSHMHIFWVHLFEINIGFRTIAKRDIFITFFNVFYLEKDNKCILWIKNMNNKFENEKLQRKNPKGPLWHDRTLHKNTGLNLCLSIYIKSLVSVFVQSVYVVFLLNK